MLAVFSSVVKNFKTFDTLLNLTFKFKKNNSKALQNSVFEFSSCIAKFSVGKLMLLMSQISKPILTLKQFILKQEVKNLYRNIFRAIRKVPDENHRKELIEWAKRDFRANAHHTDEISIKMSLRYGERCLRELETSLNLSK